MNHKIGVGLIVTSLLYILLLSAVPVSYATATNNPPPVEESESLDDVDNGTNSESVESESTRNLESEANLENEESTESDETGEDTKSMENSDSSKSSEGNDTNLEDEKLKESELITEPVEEGDKLFNKQNQSLVNGRLLNLSLFNKVTFDAVMQDNILTLNYVGDGLNIDLLGNILDWLLGGGMYIAFILPDEIDISSINSSKISAYYGNSTDNLNPIDSNNIIKDVENRSITIKIPSTLIGISTKQIYELMIEFENPISSQDGMLEFKSVASEAIIDIDLLSSNDYITSDITMPLPPEWMEIYSNTTVIRGKLPEDFKPDSTITVDIGNGEEHLADVDVNKREFSLKLDQTLSASTRVKATITTVDGLTSLTSTEDVQPAPIPIAIVSGPLDFGTVTIGSDVPLKFLEEPLEIEVHDTRGVNDKWELQARIDKPLATETGHILPNALGFYEDNEFRAFTINASETKGNAIAIRSGTTKDHNKVQFKWIPDDKQGPAIKIDHSAVYAETYSTDVIWTLVNSVQEK